MASSNPLLPLVSILAIAAIAYVAWKIYDQPKAGNYTRETYGPDPYFGADIQPILKKMGVKNYPSNEVLFTATQLSSLTQAQQKAALRGLKIASGYAI